MDMAWFRDLSITVLGFVTTAALIFLTVLIYRLYRQANSAIQLAKSTAKIAYDTIALVQQSPLSIMLTFIKGVRGGLRGISKIFKKESNKGEDKNE